jgi:ATP-binding cassette, subfamily B, multidrug efflux pump
LSNSRPDVSSKGDIAFLLPFLRPYRTRLLIGSLLIFVSVILSALPVRIVGRLIDAFKARSADPAFITESALTILALALGSGLLLFIQRRLITESSRAIEYDLKRGLLDYLHRRSALFYFRNKTGDIINHATSDLAQVREMIGAGILQFLRMVFAIGVILYMMSRISPRYTLIAFAPVALLPLVSWRLISRIGRMWRDIQEKLSRINTVVQETFSGIAEIKAYGRETWRSGLFESANEEYFKATMRQAWLGGMLWPLFGFMASLSNLFLLYFGGRGVVRGELSLGSLVSLNVFLIQLSWPLMGMGWVANLFQRGLVSTGRLRKFWSEPDPQDLSGRAEFAPGDIVIQDLTFTYPGMARPALKGIRMEIPRGKVTALTGTLGSGKSTLANLIPRLLDVERGRIFVGGRDLLDLSRVSLRSRVAMVPQETVLFSDTLRSNIVFGAKVSEEAFQKALRVSRLSKDLEQIPGGADALLGERGINLSGGQKQRAAIARAVLRDPDIILLDDCLSAVDANTEAEILLEFESFFRGRTILIISHRVNVVRNADRIYVMDDGRIQEEGTHTQLMALGGLYVKLYERQRLEEEVG